MGSKIEGGQRRKQERRVQTQRAIVAG